MSDNLSIKEAAKELGLSIETIRKMIHNGELPNAYKKRPTARTSPYVIPRTDIEAFQKTRKPGFDSQE